MANPHEEGRPIVVKRVKKGGHAAHGGSWKVAFADFAVAMMAFFLLMYLIESATPKEKIIIAGFFSDPIGFNEGGQPTVIDLGGSSSQTQKHGQEGEDDRTIPMPDQDEKFGKGDKEQAGDKNEGKEGQKDKSAVADNSAMEQKKFNAKMSEQKSENLAEIMENRRKEAEFKRFVELEQNIKKMIDQNPSLSKYKDQILLEVSAQGLQIQIMDKEKRPMYESGSDTMNPFARDILTELGKVISQVPNRISITGHTDSVPYGGGLTGYTNWELSADRANGARRALVKGGVKDEQLAQVVGLSSSMLFDTTNPLNPINRRISILVLSADSDAELSKRQKYERDLNVDQATEISADKIAPPSAKEFPAAAGVNNMGADQSDHTAPEEAQAEASTEAKPINEQDLFEEQKPKLVQPYLGADHVPDLEIKKPKVHPDDLPLPSFLPKLGPGMGEGDADSSEPTDAEHAAPAAPAGPQNAPADEPPLPSFVPKISGGGSIAPAIQTETPQADANHPTAVEQKKPATAKPLPLESTQEKPANNPPAKSGAVAPKPTAPQKPGTAPKNNAFWDE